MGRTSVIHRLFLILALALIISLGSGIAAMSPAQMLSLPNSSAQTQPAPQAQDSSDLPPLLTGTQPGQDESWLDGPLTLSFDQELDPGAAGFASVTPDLAGAFTVDGKDLVFTPTESPQPGTVYTIRLDGAAKAANGVAFGNAVEAKFTASAPLLVTSTEPSDGALEVNTASEVIVVFNRPIVALSGVDDQADLPNPLSIRPEVKGEGRWLSTSVFAFQPTTAFAGSTEYTAVVDGISDVSGVALAAPYQFIFTTAAPIVDSSLPTGNLVRPDTSVTVQFSQPMDPESTETAFSLTPSGSESVVGGETSWQNHFTTLTFTPTEWLDFGATYLIKVDDSAQPLSQQGTLRSAYSRTFTVVPTPAVDSVSPVQGAQEVSPDATVVVRFNAPVIPTLVLQNINVSPMLTTTQVFSYYSDFQNELQISWFKEPNTTYTVTIGAAIADEYGNTLGKDYVLTFTSGDYPPFVSLEADRFTHFTAYSDTRMSLLYRNVDQLSVSLYRLPQSEFFTLTGPNQYEVWQDYHVPNADDNLIWSRSYDVVEERNVAIRQVITLTDENGNELAPGIYFVEVAQPGVANLDTSQDAPAQIVDPAMNSNSTSQAVIVISNDNLVFKKSDSTTSELWLTDLRTGKPVSDVPVTYFNQGNQVAEGTTAADGTSMAEIRPDPNLTYAPVIAMAGEPGEENFAVVSSDWSSGIAIWDFNLSGGWSLDALQSYFYTDRPIYRPGQTVYWKGIVRALVNDQYQLPPNDLTIHITIHDPLGNTISEKDLTLNENGTLNGEIQLTNEALTGGYYMEVRLPLGGDKITYSGTSFVVASYRPPEFEVSLTPDKAEYQQGDTVRVTLQANYFSGGPLANAPVSWRLLSDPYNFVWDKAPQDRYYSFQPFDPDQEIYDPYSGSFYLGLIREGVATTGPDGSYVIELPADISVAPQSQNWSFDVTVQSPTNEFVSARTSVPVHKADFYIGVSPREYVGHVGQVSTVDFVSVTPQGDPYPNTDLGVVIYEYKWNSVYARGADGTFHWETSIERTPTYTTTATTNDAGMVAVDWTPTRGGQYQIAVNGTDANGNTTTSSAFLWISADDPNAFVPWPRANNDRIELVADKRLYEPGDTATVLIPSPFTGPVQALVTIERTGVVSSTVMTLEGNSETLKLPITDGDIPNFFVSVVIAKGVDESNPTPAMRLGYVQINVDTGAKELNLAVDSTVDRTEPGSTVGYTMTVTDLAGEPVKDAEVSVAIVDKAVLSLALQQDQSLVDVFYYQRPLGVQTSALLTINLDRLSAQLSEGAKGGGGGGDGGILDVRSDFLDIAYWHAELTSNDEGVITFDVKLPDNLTTWRLVAKGVTADTRVGNSTYDVIATKDLQVRPLLPRFFTAGDHAEIGATVVNAIPEDLSDGLLSIKMSGAKIVGDLDTSIPFKLTGGDSVSSNWPIEVDPAATQVVITLTATATGTQSGNTLSDAVQMLIPVNQFVAHETVATSGQVPAEGVTEAIRVPEQATDEGELEVNVEPSLAAGMTDGLTYLRDYPYESTEQTISSFLPNIFTARATNQRGIDDATLEAGLDTAVNSGVQRLVNRQNQDGGWGYWPGEYSSAFITAYALWGLETAAKEGYTVPEDTIQKALDYLERSFVAPDQIDNQWQLNEMSFMLYVLSEIGQGDPGRTSTLYDVRERLGLYGKALLAMTLNNLQAEGAHDSRIDTLLDDLYGAANVTGTSTWWQEESVDYRNLNTDTRTTAIILDAFIRMDPEQPLLPNAVRWLMETRQDGHWSNTQDTTWSLIALTDWLTLTSEANANYNWEVTLNDESMGSGAVTPQNVTETVTLRAQITDLLRDQLNVLRFSRDNGLGRMYYTTDLRYSLDAAQVDSRDRGVAVERFFALADDAAGSAIDAAKVGDVISVTVTIVAPTDLFHLKVEVPIPAGTVPIDSNLATTSDQFNPPQMTGDITGDTTGVEAQPVWWRQWTPTYTDLRDDKVAVFATFLPAGTYQYTFNVRASVPGEFKVLPATAEQTYFPDVWGRSAGATFKISN